MLRWLLLLCLSLAVSADWRQYFNENSVPDQYTLCQACSLLRNDTIDYGVSIVKELLDAKCSEFDGNDRKEVDCKDFRESFRPLQCLDTAAKLLAQAYQMLSVELQSVYCDAVSFMNVKRSITKTKHRILSPRVENCHIQKTLACAIYSTSSMLLSFV